MDVVTAQLIRNVTLKVYLMRLSSIAAIGFTLTNAMASITWASEASVAPPPEMKVIDIAGHTVPIVKGGLYDRYRSNPPLSVIEAEAPDIDLSWFKQLKKVKVDMGFESYSPNFFYKNSRITAVFTADLARLKELMPPEVLSKVQPLQIWPGRGVVALTAYTYRYCDNDPYHEVGLAVATTKPGATSFGPFTLMRQASSKDLWGYVLKLPLNSELGRVRGVVGYNLPKWLTTINLREDQKSMAFEIFDAETGKPDLVIEGKRLGELSNKVEMVTSHFTTVNRNGAVQTGYAVLRDLSHAVSKDADSVTLTLGDGSLSQYIKSLGLGKMLRYEYVPQFQGALYAVEPLPDAK